MGALIKQLFCHHKYSPQFRTHYTFVIGSGISTEHLYVCCKCGAHKYISINNEEV